MNCERMERAVKYCGGCNPRFDRVAAAASLGFAGAPSARPGVPCGTLLVVCGCTARCADLSGLEADRILLVSTPEEAKRARAAQNKTV